MVFHNVEARPPEAPGSSCLPSSSFLSSSLPTPKPPPTVASVCVVPARLDPAPPRPSSSSYCHRAHNIQHHPPSAPLSQASVNKVWQTDEVRSKRIAKSKVMHEYITPIVGMRTWFSALKTARTLTELYIHDAVSLQRADDANEMLNWALV